MLEKARARAVSGEASPVEILASPSRHGGLSSRGHTHFGVACAHPPPQERSDGSSRWIDMLGTVSGMVCLVHCLATPLVLGAVTLLPSMGAFLHGTLELILIGVTLILAWVSVGASLRVHQRRLPVALLMGGTLLAATTLLTPEESPLEMAFSMGGSALLVSSIWVNRIFLRRASDPLPLEPLAADA